MGASENDPAVQEWLADHHTESGSLAALWFRVIRSCGADVLELVHDGNLTACVGEVPFVYVGAFKAHASIGFFYGADLADPAGLLEGAGKRMRHTKLMAKKPLDSVALEALITSAYRDVKQRIAAG